MTCNVSDQYPENYAWNEIYVNRLLPISEMVLSEADHIVLEAGWYTAKPNRSMVGICKLRI